LDGDVREEDPLRVDISAPLELLHDAPLDRLA